MFLKDFAQAMNNIRIKNYFLKKLWRCAQNLLTSEG